MTHKNPHQSSAETMNQDNVTAIGVVEAGATSGDATVMNASHPTVQKHSKPTAKTTKTELEGSESTFNLTKKSWFTNLFFQQKQTTEPMPFLHVKSQSEFNELGKALKSLGIQYQERIEEGSSSSFKCKFTSEDGKEGCKFRLNFDSKRGGLNGVKCIHQQGVHQLFLQKVHELSQLV